MIFLKYLYHVYKKNGLHVKPNIIHHFFIYKEWKAINSKGKSLLELQLPWISVASKNMISDFLQKNGRLNIFEFGSGGSSLFFNNNGAKLISIEHDKEWFNKLNEIKEKTNTQWQIIHVPPEIKNVSQKYPSVFPGYENADFSSYVKSIDTYENDTFDLILVDGRCRLKCLKHARKKVKIGGWIVLDNAERKRYFEEEVLDKLHFKLIFDHYGALIGSYQFVKTNIYCRKK